MCDRDYHGDSCHIQSTFWESRQVQKSTTPAKFHSAITKHLLFSNTVAKSEPTLNHSITNIQHQSNHDLQPLPVCVSTNGLQGKTVISRDTIRPDYQLSGLTRLTASRLRQEALAKGLEGQEGLQATSTVQYRSSATSEYSHLFGRLLAAAGIGLGLDTNTRQQGDVVLTWTVALERKV